MRDLRPSCAEFNNIDRRRQLSIHLGPELTDVRTVFCTFFCQNFHQSCDLSQKPSRSEKLGEVFNDFGSHPAQGLLLVWKLTGAATFLVLFSNLLRLLTTAGATPEQTKTGQFSWFRR
jgi:hypothetical protein